MEVKTVGRSSVNDVVISDAKVSRHHLQIIRDDYGNFRLADFGSTNGTYINGTKIKGEVRLSLNDIVKIGNTVLPWKTYFNDVRGTDIDKRTIDIINGGYTRSASDPKPELQSIGVFILMLGLVSIGLIAYIIINYFTSLGNQLALIFGGMESSLKLFPIYLRGYFGVGGQWVPMIAALVLGLVADFIEYVIDSNKEDKLSSAGKSMANIAITVAGIFILFAIFAPQIMKMY